MRYILALKITSTSTYGILLKLKRENGLVKNCSCKFIEVANLNAFNDFDGFFQTVIFCQNSFTTSYL